jgi:hypothetical protein
MAESSGTGGISTESESIDVPQNLQKMALSDISFPQFEQNIKTPLGNIFNANHCSRFRKHCKQDVYECTLLAGVT